MTKVKNFTPNYISAEHKLYTINWRCKWSYYFFPSLPKHEGKLKYLQVILALSLTLLYWHACTDSHKHLFNNLDFSGRIIQRLSFKIIAIILTAQSCDTLDYQLWCLVIVEWFPSSLDLVQSCKTVAKMEQNGAWRIQESVDSAAVELSPSFYHLPTSYSSWMCIRSRAGTASGGIQIN